MKNVSKILVIVLISCILHVNLFAATDEYDELIRDFFPVESLTTESKVAIVPFSFIDNREDVEGSGGVISERLTTRMVQLKVYKVVDRQNLEKVLQEQKLQTSGLIDNETAKSLGKILGVDAIITGTMLSIDTNKIELNAKLIRTETAEILAAGSVKITKDWGRKKPEQAPSIQYQQSLQQQASMKQRDSGFDMFFDLLILNSISSSMDLTLSNSEENIHPAHFDFSIDLDGDNIADNVPTDNVEFDSLATDVNTGVGFRILGFMNYIGLGFEVLSFNQTVGRQKATGSYGPYSMRWSINAEDYLKVSTIAMDVGLYARFAKKTVQPYVGFNVGISINHIYSPYIRSYNDSLIWQDELDTVETGFLVSMPVGVRFCVGRNFTVFTEFMTITNTVSFTRNIEGEDDKIVAQNEFFTFGLSYRF